eukprot:TRINITY_DN33357_c0_g1_i3.p1 TRINITY_DN33357_c0_g1~~TRINITY_DN33357_c0_g1_i3.p1  ORF type:complete len:134 (-),score=9.98 TRINITY_DN33357_c0_g1_i3:107-508(-)
MPSLVGSEMCIRDRNCWYNFMTSNFIIDQLTPKLALQILDYVDFPAVSTVKTDYETYSYRELVRDDPSHLLEQLLLSYYDNCKAVQARLFIRRPPSLLVCIKFMIIPNCSQPHFRPPLPRRSALGASTPFENH